MTRPIGHRPNRSHHSNGTTTATPEPQAPVDQPVTGQCRNAAPRFSLSPIWGPRIDLRNFLSSSVRMFVRPRRENPQRESAIPNLFDLLDQERGAPSVLRDRLTPLLEEARTSLLLGARDAAHRTLYRIEDLYAHASRSDQEDCRSLRLNARVLEAMIRQDADSAVAAIRQERIENPTTPGLEALETWSDGLIRNLRVNHLSRIIESSLVQEASDGSDHFLELNETLPRVRTYGGPRLREEVAPEVRRLFDDIESGHLSLQNVSREIGPRLRGLLERHGAMDDVRALLETPVTTPRAMSELLFDRTRRLLRNEQTVEAVSLLHGFREGDHHDEAASSLLREHEETATRETEIKAFLRGLSVVFAESPDEVVASWAVAVPMVAAEILSDGAATYAAPVVEGLTESLFLRSAVQFGIRRVVPSLAVPLASHPEGMSPSTLLNQSAHYLALQMFLGPLGRVTSTPIANYAIAVGGMATFDAATDPTLRGVSPLLQLANAAGNDLVARISGGIGRTSLRGAVNRGLDRMARAGLPLDFQFAVLTRDQIINGTPRRAGDVVFWDAGGFTVIAEERARAERAGYSHRSATADDIVARAHQTAEIMSQRTESSIVSPPPNQENWEPWNLGGIPELLRPVVTEDRWGVISTLLTSHTPEMRERVRSIRSEVAQGIAEDGGYRNLGQVTRAIHQALARHGFQRDAIFNDAARSFAETGNVQILMDARSALKALDYVATVRFLPDNTPLYRAVAPAALQAGVDGSVTMGSNEVGKSFWHIGTPSREDPTVYQRPGHALVTQTVGVLRQYGEFIYDTQAITGNAVELHHTPRPNDRLGGWANVPVRRNH